VARDFLLYIPSRLATGPTQTSLKSAQAIFLGNKAVGCGVDNPPTSSTEVKNEHSYVSVPILCLHVTLWGGLQLLPLLTTM